MQSIRHIRRQGYNFKFENVWSNEITELFLIQAGLEWFHGLMKEISLFGLHFYGWPQTGFKRVNTNGSMMQQFVMFTPLLSTAFQFLSSTAWHDASTCFSSELGGRFVRRRSSNFSWSRFAKSPALSITMNAKMPSHTTLWHCTILYLHSGYSVLLNLLLSAYMKTEEQDCNCMTIQL